MTTQFGGSNYQKIMNFIDLVQRKGRKDVKYFHFDDGKKFIVDGNKLKLLPFDKHHLYSKDEFYVHVNPVEKKIMYYAFDVENLVTPRNTNEEEGYMDWNDLEDCIYNFFVLNIKELADSMAPYVEVTDPNPKPASSSHSSSSSFSSGSTYSGPTNYNNYNSYNSPYGYGTQAYKDREAFYDKLWALLKENKTSKAMDHISAHLKKMCADKKYDELDHLIKMITFDKLNTITMLGILDITNDDDHLLKSRKEFFDKVRTHLVKVKPAWATNMLRPFEPGKSNAKSNTGENKSI